MLKAGVTGGIGSGKSIACRIFALLGVPVYEADVRAKYLTAHDKSIVASITGVFGPEAYDEQGNYNRPFISQKVFKDKSLLNQLNAIVHPAVADDFANWSAARSHFPYILKEAALMNAAGENNDLDKVIVVITPENLRIARIKQRDTHRTEEEITAIIRNQRSEAAFRSIADYVLTNDDTSLLVPQILQVHRELLRLSGHEA